MIVNNLTSSVCKKKTQNFKANTYELCHGSGKGTWGMASLCLSLFVLVLQSPRLNKGQEEFLEVNSNQPNIPVLQIPDLFWLIHIWALLHFCKKTLLGVAVRHRTAICTYSLLFHAGESTWVSSDPSQRLKKEDRDPCFMGSAPLRDQARCPKANM